jgi:hypothetical protein
MEMGDSRKGDFIAGHLLRSRKTYGADDNEREPIKERN